MSSANKTVAYLVTVVERSHSSGAETRWDKIFLSLEGASQYMKDYIAGIAMDFDYPEGWDVDDYNGEKFPKTSYFCLENLKEYLEKIKADKKSRYADEPYWGPYSNYEAQRPIEIFLKETTINQ